MSSQAENRPPRRRASRLPYVVALFLLGLLIVMPWVLKDRFQPVVSGAPAPDITVTNLLGEPVRLADYRGKVVLLNVWATWCEPCRKEMPSMERLYTTVKALGGGEDFEILAVSIDATKESPNPLYGGVTREELEAYVGELGLTFPIVRDPAGDVQEVYQTTGVPESFLVGRDGIIYKKRAGPEEWDATPNVELIKSLLEREWSGAQDR
jgi:peroxiredoxin